MCLSAMATSRAVALYSPQHTPAARELITNKSGATANAWTTVSEMDENLPNALDPYQSSTLTCLDIADPCANQWLVNHPNV